MTFTLFSVALLLFIGLAMLIEIVRGMKRGFSRTALGLATVVISAVVAMALAVLLSDVLAESFADPMMEMLMGSVGDLDALMDQMPHLENVLMAAIDMIMTLLLFGTCFIALRILLRIVVRIAFRSLWRVEPCDPREAGSKASPKTLSAPCYEGQNGSWVRRHDCLLGGLTGAVTGFLVAFLLLVPVTGTISFAGDVIDDLWELGLISERENEDVSEEMDASDGNVPLANLASTTGGQSTNTTTYISDPFTDDVVVAALDAAGGRVLFNAMTVSNLSGKTVTLREEVDAALEIFPDFIEIINLMFDNEKLTRRQVQTVNEFGGKLAESQTMCVLASDFVGGASGAWLHEREYMGISAPAFGSFVTPIVNQVFAYFATQYSGDEYDPTHVAEDLNTLLQVYLIAADSGVMQQMNAGDMMICLDEGNVLDRIYSELRSNPRMA